VAAFFNALSWIILIPVWQYPDEQAHFAQVQDIAEIGEVPPATLDTSYEISLSEEILGTSRDGFGNNKYTYHPEYKLEYTQNYFGIREQEILQLPKSSRTELVKREATVNPPLYYILGASIYKLFGNGSLLTRVYAVRMMSAVIFITTIYFSFQIGKLIFAKSQFLPIIIASLVAFKPMLVFASTGVLPDTLTNLLFSLIIYMSLQIILKGFSPKILGLSALIVFMGFLTRQQFSISILIIFLAIIFRIIIYPKYIKQIAVLILATSLTYYLLSLNTSVPILSNFRFQEDPLSALNMVSISSFAQFTFWTMKHTVSEVLPWYWGVYRWLSLTLPAFVYQIINRLLILSFLGILVRFISVAKNRQFTKTDLTILFLIVSSLVYFLTISIGDYLFHLKYGYSFGIQGRYFFPLVVAHLSIILFGFWTIVEFLFKRKARYFLILILILVIIFNDFTLFNVSSSFYENSNIAKFIIQASQYKPILFKGYTILTIITLNLISQIVLVYLLTEKLIKSKNS